MIVGGPPTKTNSGDIRKKMIQNVAAKLYILASISEYLSDMLSWYICIGRSISESIGSKVNRKIFIAREWSSAAA